MAKPQKKTKQAEKKTKPPRRAIEPPPVDAEALSVRQFCLRYGISKPLLYREWAAGRGPAFYKVGTRRLIRIEAARAWALQREAEQMAKVG